MIQVVYVICWWLFLLFLGLLSFPLVSRVCSGLTDKGYSISKLVGLIVWFYFAWMLSSLKLISFGYTSIILSLLLLTIISFYLGRKNLGIVNWPWKKIIVSESIFTAFFIIFLLIIRGQPDIYSSGGSDALINNAFIQSILRGGFFPPENPWFSGEILPYYYGEHVMVAMLSRITNVPPTIAFNIAIAMFLSLAVGASYGLGYNITRRKLYGILAAVFVCLAGFTSGAFQLMAFAFNHEILGYSPSGTTNIIDWLLWFDIFHAHWVIDGAIVHYPYSSFLMADLHSYSVSPTFQLMFILLVFAVLRKSRLNEGISLRDSFLDISVLALCLGFFFILNTWEYPTYIIFTVLAFILLRIKPTFRSSLGVSMAIVVLSFVLYLAYYIQGNISQFTGLGLVSTRVTLAHFLQFGALFLFATFSLLFILSKQDLFRHRTAILITFFIFIATILAAILLSFQLLIIVVPMGLLAFYFIYRFQYTSEVKFVLLLYIMSAALAFFGDFIYINDNLSVPWERFNTAMKVYLQLWVFFGVAAACAVFFVMRNLGKKIKFLWITVLAVLIIASLIHPVATTTAKLGGRYTDWGINSGTLDGMAYVEIVDKGAYDAIQWINEEIKGSPIMLEASRIGGNPTGRVSTFTGVPTVIGWANWDLMWRRNRDEVEERVRDVEMIYNTLDYSEAMDLLRKYGVEYIYIGSLERELYEKEGVDKFLSRPDDYGLLYNVEGVTIYKVIE